MPEHNAHHRTATVVLDGTAEHTLRNHLSIILGFCDVMQLEMDASHRMHEDLHEIRKAAQAALAILNDATRR
jgi:quercetin dioxygenase-like cupin family protein